jgi:hypothetical protein
MTEGSCHCGKVRWRFAGVPQEATSCNCTLCRRYGALWIYDYEDQGIHVAGPTRVYVRENGRIGFHFCPDCGCIAYWRGLTPLADGRRRMAVNLRMAEPDGVGDIPVHHFDGLKTWKGLPRGGRTVKDMWF